MAIENENPGQGGSKEGEGGTPSLVGSAGQKPGEGGSPKEGAGDEAAKKAAAEKDAADRSALEKTLAKELEGKTDAEKKELLDKKLAEQRAAEQKGKEGAPKEYAKFNLPEGFEADEPTMKAFVEIARKHNLSQEAAQEFVDFQAKQEVARGKAEAAEFEKVRKAWRDETVKELGANFDAESANVGRFLERFGSPELRKLADATGVGDNKHWFMAMAKAGATLGEGKLPENGGGGGKEEDQGKRWYGDSMKKAGAAKS